MCIVYCEWYVCSIEEKFVDGGVMNVYCLWRNEIDVFWVLMILIWVVVFVKIRKILVRIIVINIVYILIILDYELFYMSCFCWKMILKENEELCV